MVGGAGLSYVVYKFLGLFLSLLLVPPILGVALALTFIKVNNKPFIFTLEAWLKFTINKYLMGGALYIWKKGKKKKVEKAEDEKKEEIKFVPKFSESKLRDISWGLDVLDAERRT